MIGDLLIVHVRDTQPSAPRLPIGDEIRSLRWVLNVYVPLYFELRKIGDGGRPIEANPRRDELQSIFQGLVDKIGRMFNGWTEIGLVATTWSPAVWNAAKGMELRWIYQHMLIATLETSWKERLQIAEAECEESLLAAVMYSMDFSSPLVPFSESI
jgi:hypothetical protein